jgi:magnesium chelatase subunit I
VGLLNILEEKDIQIRGFPIRLELDVTMLFTANPEDYTNRGRIITPLKDRIASQVITHYPDSIEETIKIMEQEAQVCTADTLVIPELGKTMLAEIAVQARSSDLVDQSSGVSARLCIAAYELLVTQIERRRATYGEEHDGVRLSDLYATVPAICGKLELVFEGQETGAEVVAQRMVAQAVKAVFTRTFKIEKKSKHDDPLEIWEPVIQWFNEGGKVTFVESQPRQALRDQLAAVPNLKTMVCNTLGELDGDELDLAMSMVLDGLHHYRHLSKDGLGRHEVYGDALSDLMNDFGEA